MRVQVILDFLFARPGSDPIGGGKKGEFRDWTSGGAAILTSRGRRSRLSEDIASDSSLINSLAASPL